jgi:hypothetical protein
MLEQALRFAGSNEIVLGVATLCGIAGFVLTIIVTIRTAKISKILRYNQVTSQYNKERTGFQKTFEGHRKSIIEDGLQSDKLLKDILKNVEAYRSKFQEILSLKDRFTLFMFVRLLKKESNKVNFNSVCNYLAILSGRLSKKEDKKNG